LLHDIAYLGVSMGMVVLGLYCMVFYSVLIILSVFQTDRCSEGAWVGGRAGGTVHGDSFLPSLLLWSGSKYLSSMTAWSFFWCSGLSRPRHNVITSYGWGIERSDGKRSCPSSGDMGGIGALRARSDI